ncbi:MAG TPA: hypothetical protein VFQ54_09070, partial [Thermomicrobiales bacterium]|nr:hypothetical protein [Thermomicrobiales bacterium]
MSTTTQKRPLTADDLFAIKLVGNPVASPDGKHIAWVVVTVDKEKDGYVSAIWIADADGGNQRKLTAGSARDTSPVWSPDGTQLAFVSNRAPSKPFPKPAKADKADEEKQGKKPVKPAADRLRNQVWTIAID